MDLLKPLKTYETYIIFLSNLTTMGLSIIHGVTHWLKNKQKEKKNKQTKQNKKTKTKKQKQNKTKHLNDDFLLSFFNIFLVTREKTQKLHTYIFISPFLHFLPFQYC